MGGLEEGVALVGPVEEPVVGLGLGLGGDPGGQVALPGGVLVDVVAQEEHEVEVVLGHLLVGRPVAGGAQLAGGEGDAQLVDARPPWSGVVRVRPTGLVKSPTRKRYQ